MTLTCNYSLRLKTKIYQKHTNHHFIKCLKLKLEDAYEYNSSFFSTHNQLTRNLDMIPEPFHRLSLTQNSVTYLGGTVWNSSTLFIRYSASISIFKVILKESLLHRYGNYTTSFC